LRVQPKQSYHRRHPEGVHPTEGSQKMIKIPPLAEFLILCYNYINKVFYGRSSR
jgi:hypothetical protein